MEKRRVVEIYVPTDGAVGSGYLLTPSLILTARHVVAAILDDRGPPEVGTHPPDTTPACRVRPLASTAGTQFHDAWAVWWIDDTDAALLVTANSYPLGQSLPGIQWSDLPGSDPVEVSAVGFPDAVVEGNVRESRQLLGRVAPFSGAKAGRWVVHAEGSLGEVPAGSRSVWAGMSGAALFAGDVLVGIIVVDADPTHPERLELWSVPARQFAADEGLQAWLRGDGGAGALSPALAPPQGSLGLLRSIADANALVRVLPEAVMSKLLTALDAQREARTDEESRRAVARVLALLRSRGVLYAQLDDESWQQVFASLRGLRDTFAACYAEVIATGPAHVAALVDIMLTATRDYVTRHEANYSRHMADRPGDQSLAHWEREWPGREAAGLDLLALREVLVGAVEPLNAFVHAEDQMHLAADSPIRRYELGNF